MNGINSKKLIFKIENHNWGLKTIYTWSIKTFYIYDDFSVEYKVENGEGKKKSYLHIISDEDLKKITQNIELVKSNNNEVQAFDGEAWEFVQYESDNVLWKRKLGYIYGIKPLENICSMLIDLVENDSDVFILDEMEEKNMGLFSNNNKYDIEEEDNTPRFVYGIPDAMRKQWEKEDNEKNKKYDIEEEDNRSQAVYGIPDAMRKQWEEESKAKIDQESSKSKYDINPENNIPYELYGIAKAKKNENKYDIRPEENVPQKVYGVPILRCPYCDSTELWEYLYGETTYDYEKDKYILGGCIITGNEPTHKCKKCGKDIYLIKESKMPRTDFKKRIFVNIKKNNYSFNIQLNSYRNDDYCDIAFIYLNKSPAYVYDISKENFNVFLDRLNTIISNWKNNYSGEKNISWRINIIGRDNSKLFLGNGGIPENWDDLIDLLIEYEKNFNVKRNVEPKKNEDNTSFPNPFE